MKTNIDLFQAIENVIHPNFKLETPGGQATLVEHKNKERQHETGVCYKTVVKKSGKLLILQLDFPNSPNLFPIFDNSREGITNVADYILIFPKQQITYIAICELKSQNTQGFPKKFATTYALLQMILQKASEKLNFHLPRYEIFGIEFSKNSRIKFETQPSKIRPIQFINNPEWKYFQMKCGVDCYLDVLIEAIKNFKEV